MNTPDTALTDTTCTPVTTTPAIQKKATRATILLAEDDRSIRRFLEIILQRAGYEVIVAADGLEAMKMVLTKTIDAVITDAVMPHLNGYELCRFLRRHAQLSHLPVILLSGLERADDGCEEKCRADVYLSKPVRPEELNACLTRLLPEIP